MGLFCFGDCFALGLFHTVAIFLHQSLFPHKHKYSNLGKFIFDNFLNSKQKLPLCIACNRSHLYTKKKNGCWEIPSFKKCGLAQVSNCPHKCRGRLRDFQIVSTRWPYIFLKLYNSIACLGNFLRIKKHLFMIQIFYTLILYLK